MPLNKPIKTVSHCYLVGNYKAAVPVTHLEGALA